MSALQITSFRLRLPDLRDPLQPFFGAGLHQVLFLWELPAGRLRSGSGEEDRPLPPALGGGLPRSGPDVLARLFSAQLREGGAGASGAPGVLPSVLGVRIARERV